MRQLASLSQGLIAGRRLAFGIAWGPLWLGLAPGSLTWVFHAVWCYKYLQAQTTLELHPDEADMSIRLSTDQKCNLC